MNFNYKTSTFDDGYIVDPNAFVFTLKSNGRVNKMERYELPVDHKQRSFSLFKPEMKLLFQFGCGDISIFKEDYRESCFCSPNSFVYYTQTNSNNQQINYQHDISILVGKRENQPFVVKHFSVFQMKETHPQMRLFYQQKRKDEIMKQQNLQRFSVVSKSLTENEFKNIEAFTKCYVKEVLFDSRNDNYALNTSTFDDKIFGKENLVFFVSDQIGNSIAVHIRSKINQISTIQNNMMIDRRITDGEAFIFFPTQASFNLLRPLSCDIKPAGIPCAFTLYQKNYPVLFEVGVGDLIVMKQNTKQSTSRENMYQQLLWGQMTRENLTYSFNPKSIIVLQMFETDELVSIRLEKKRKQLDDETNVMFKLSNEFKQSMVYIKQTIEASKQKTKFGQTLLNKLSAAIIDSVSKGLCQFLNEIELKIHLKFDELVFASKQCSWKMTNSSFHKRVMGRGKILILCRSLKNPSILFGGYLEQKVDRYLTDDATRMCGIKDSNGFVFSFDMQKKSDGLIMYKPKSNDEIVFGLGVENDRTLFVFGKDDIWIGKEGLKAMTRQSQMSSFNYPSGSETLTKLPNGEFFDIDFILVYQMI